MKVSAKKFFIAVLVVLLTLLGLSFKYGSSKPSVGMLLPVTAVYGLISWCLVAFLSSRLKRPFGLVDALRCTGWIIIGCSYGISPNGYDVFLWPQYASLARPVAQSGAIVGILTVILATILIPALQAPKAGCCSECGYDLTGNASGVCPECGTAIPTISGK